MQGAATLTANFPAYAEPGRKPAAVLAVLVHAILFSFLFFGLRWSSKAPDAVVVELWTQPAVSEPVPKVEPAPKPEPAPVPKVETPPPPAPKAATPVRKPDIAIEKEKKPLRKEEPKLQIDARSRIQEQLARETQTLAQERQKVTPTATPRPTPPATAPVIDPGYANRIRLKIKGNIVVPADISGNPEAIFDVIQLPTGEVLSATLRRSSGNRAFDDAVERAILKSSPLPRPDNSSQFQRQLELKFRPQE